MLSIIWQGNGYKMSRQKWELNSAIFAIWKILTFWVSLEENKLRNFRSFKKRLIALTITKTNTDTFFYNQWAMFLHMYKVFLNCSILKKLDKSQGTNWFCCYDREYCLRQALRPCVSVTVSNFGIISRNYTAFRGMSNVE